MINPKTLQSWSTAAGLSIVLGSGVLLFAISNKCAATIEGNASGFKFQVEACSNSITDTIR